MDNPTPESMRPNLHTVYYELRMLNEVCVRLRDDYREKVESDALLESFLLHVRNLVEFFKAIKRNNDDLRSIDFLDKSGKPIERISVDLPEKDKRDLHEYLSHMTKTRVTKRTWKVEQLRQKVNAAMREFLDKLSPAVFPTPEGKTKGDFERLIDTPVLVAARAQRTATRIFDCSTD
jgi:hypothetical protein